MNRGVDPDAPLLTEATIIIQVNNDENETVCSPDQSTIAPTPAPPTKSTNSSATTTATTGMTSSSNSRSNENIASATYNDSSNHQFDDSNVRDANLVATQRRSRKTCTTSAGIADLRTRGQQQSFRTPDGDLIDGKNTLRSFESPGLSQRQNFYDVTATSPQQQGQRKYTEYSPAATPTGGTLDTTRYTPTGTISTNFITVNALTVPSYDVVEAQPYDNNSIIYDANQNHRLLERERNEAQKRLQKIKKYSIIMSIFLELVCVIVVLVVVLVFNNNNDDDSNSTDSNNSKSNNTNTDVSSPTPPSTVTTTPFSPTTLVPGISPVVVTSTPTMVTLSPTFVPTIFDPSLSSLQIACNFLSFTSLTQCQNTTQYMLPDITGTTIPTEIGLLTQLTYLSLIQVGLSGTIPTNIGSLTRLTYLDLNANVLSGPIPTTIDMLTQLTYLSLWGNRLTNTIPTTLSTLTSLRFLAINDNALTGTISIISDITTITYLDLSFNQLNGSIPSSFSKLTLLEYFYIFNNPGLTGTIPSSLCNNTIAGQTQRIEIDCDQINCTCCRASTQFNSGTICE